MILRKLFAALGALILSGVPASAASNAQFLLRFHMAYDRDAVAYFAALVANGCTTPSASFKGVVNTYITAEKAARNWGGQDFAYITTTADSCTASVNLAQPALYKITYSGACTFSATLGLNGDSATCVGNTGINMNALTRVSQNNSHFVICFGSPGGGGAGALGLAGVAGSTFYTSATNKTTRSTSAASLVDTNGGGAGCHYADRTNSTQLNTGKNGIAQSVAVANASAAPDAAHLVICQQNATFCTSSIRDFFTEVGQPIPNELTHYNNLRTMLVALGATGI